jgi:ribonuclease VapC
MPRRFVLDSSAVLAYLQDEPGAQDVENLILSEDAALHLSVISLGEVLYVVRRVHGDAVARQVEAAIFDSPKIRIEEATWERVRAAAMLKAASGLGYADGFGASLAQELDAALLTADADFARLEATGEVQVAWLRSR